MLLVFAIALAGALAFASSCWCSRYIQGFSAVIAATPLAPAAAAARSEVAINFGQYTMELHTKEDALVEVPPDCCQRSMARFSGNNVKDILNAL